jgi:hypothetical protein
MKLKLILVAASLLFISCGSIDPNLTLLPTATDGLCGVHKELDSKGNPYYIGACTNESVLIQWTQDNQEWRAIRPKKGSVRFYLKDEKGIFQPIDSKAPNPDMPDIPRKNNDIIL